VSGREDPAPLRVLIVDDEAPARDRLQALLAGHSDITVTAACADGRAAIAAIEQTRPDLVFLDVQMPEVDGFDVIAGVGVERMPAFVFVTAFERHAVQAFEVQALDYLVKPFDRARFENALARARAQIRRGRPEAGGPPLRSPTLLDRLLVPEGEQMRVVRTEAIDWIEAAGNYVELHVAGRIYLLRSTLTALEARLDPETFLRVHRDTIVQVSRIHSLHRWHGGQFRVVLGEGVERPVGRSYQARLEQRLGKL
jgi:two-component system LytT family response regulator